MRLVHLIDVPLKQRVKAAHEVCESYRMREGEREEVVFAALYPSTRGYWIVGMTTEEKRLRELCREAVYAVDLAWGWLKFFDGHEEMPDAPLLDVFATLDKLRVELSAETSRA